MNYQDFERRSACQEFLLKKLTQAMDVRDRWASTDLWIEFERNALADATWEWAKKYGGRAIPPSEIESYENMAVGHVDYARKICLYTAERVCA